MNTHRTTTGSQNARSGTSTNRGTTTTSGRPVPKVASQASTSGKAKIDGNPPTLASSGVSIRKVPDQGKPAINTPKSVSSTPARPVKAPAAVSKAGKTSTLVSARSAPKAPASERSATLSTQAIQERKIPAPLVVNMPKAAGRVRAFKSNEEVGQLLWKAQDMGDESHRNKALFHLAKDAQIDPLQRLETAKTITESLRDNTLIEFARDPGLAIYRKRFVHAITDTDLRNKALNSSIQPKPKGPQRTATPSLKQDERPTEKAIQEEPLLTINQAPPVLKLSRDEKHRQKALDSTQSGLSRLFSAQDIKDETLRDETYLNLVKDTKMEIYWRKQTSEAITDEAKKEEALSILEKAQDEKYRQRPWIATTGALCG